MKVHCAGLKGWFDACPQVVPTPARSMFLTDDQAFLFANAALIIGGVLVGLFIIIFMQYLVGLLSD